MTEISFYHLLATPLEKALPKLLEKIYLTGKRSLLLARDETQVENLNTLLWSYTTKFFLPHGSSKDRFPEEQPIFLTPEETNPNGAVFVVVVDGRVPNALAQYERCIDMFDGQDEAAVAAARKRWSQYKEAGHTLTYWKQNDQGGWDKAA